jgi:hypothetical protein
MPSDQFEHGWYRDPLDQTRMRYWTGTSWSATSDPIRPDREPLPAAPPGMPTPLTRRREETPTQFQKRVQARAASRAREQIVCPHCQVAGHVRATQTKVKKGVSGGKATGALLTGGLSMLATGLSRKETVTQMHCTNCNVTWHA